MMEELWLIWKEPKTRKKYKIGILTKEKDIYKFCYVSSEVEEAKKYNFKYYPGFSDLTKTYKSDELFENIRTRLPNVTRPDYLEILNCYDLEKDSTEIEILKSTRGRTITDNYEFVPAFDKSKIEFDVAGTKYSNDINVCKKYLQVNKKLYLEQDKDNNYDKYAIKIIFKENDKSYHLGYVPRYYCKELSDILNKGIEYSAMVQSLKFDSIFSDENITAKVKLIFNI